MAQSVKPLTFDFCSGCHLRVVGSSPVSGSTLSLEPAWNSLSLSLCPSPTHVHVHTHTHTHTHTHSLSLSLSINKYFKNISKYVYYSNRNSSVLKFHSPVTEVFFLVLIRNICLFNYN